MIHVLQSVSRAGGTSNEDLIRYDDHMLMILDGSSSLVPMECDGRWFTRSFAREIKKYSDEDLVDRVNHTLKNVSKQYRKKQPEYTGNDFPSAAGIFVSERDGSLEILAIGDCTGYFFLKDGRMIMVTDNAVKLLDDGVLNYCRSIRPSSGKTYAELMKTDEVKALLLENRHKMNTPDGYRILSVNMPPCERTDLTVLPADQVRRIVLFSDGFDVMNEELKQQDLSLRSLYKELRRREAEDPDYERMPRFKPSDDASALIAEIG